MLKCWSSGQWGSPSSFTWNFLSGSHLNVSPSEILCLMDYDKAQRGWQLTLLLPPWSHHKFCILKLYYFVISWRVSCISLGYIRVSCFASSSWLISVSGMYAENPQTERTIYPSWHLPPASLSIPLLSLRWKPVLLNTGDDWILVTHWLNFSFQYKGVPS